MGQADRGSKKLYDSWHRTAGEGERASSGSPFHPWHETALRLLPDLNDRDVLEVGCGRGDFTIELFRRFPRARIMGVDFSSTAIELAKAKRDALGVDVDFAICDAQALPFTDSSFDWIISCECLEHVPSPARMAAEIRRTLRPGAQFILTTENYLNGMLLSWAHSLLTRKPFNSGSGVQPLEHFFIFTHVRRLLIRAGLSISHMESNHFQWLLLPRVDPAKLCTPDVSNPVLRRLLLPFGRHFTYMGRSEKH